MILEVPSDSVPDKTYYVNTEQKTCTCPGFLYRGYCKHLSRALEAEESEEQEFWYKGGSNESQAAES